MVHPDLANLIADFYVDDTGGKYKVHGPPNLLMKAHIVKCISTIQHLLPDDMTPADWHDEVDQFDEAKSQCNTTSSFRIWAKAIDEGFILAAKIPVDASAKFRGRGKATFRSRPSTAFALTPTAKHTSGPWKDKPLLAANAVKQRNRIGWLLAYLKKRQPTTYDRWARDAKGTVEALRRDADQTLSYVSAKQIANITNGTLHGDELIEAFQVAEQIAQYHVQTIVKTERRKAHAQHRAELTSPDAGQYAFAALKGPQAGALQFVRLPDDSYTAEPHQVDQHFTAV